MGSVDATIRDRIGVSGTPDGSDDFSMLEYLPLPYFPGCVVVDGDISAP